MIVLGEIAKCAEADFSGIRSLQGLYSPVLLSPKGVGYRIGEGSDVQIAELLFLCNFRSLSVQQDANLLVACSLNAPVLGPTLRLHLCRGGKKERGSLCPLGWAGARASLWRAGTALGKLSGLTMPITLCGSNSLSLSEASSDLLSFGHGRISSSGNSCRGTSRKAQLDCE